MPRKLTRTAPLHKDVKTINGTMKIRYIQILLSNEYLSANLSCSCQSCLYNGKDPCIYTKWIETTKQSITSSSATTTRDHSSTCGRQSIRGSSPSSRNNIRPTRNKSAASQSCHHASTGMHKFICLISTCF